MTAEGQLKDDRGAYRPGLSAALSAIIVTATAAFFVIATRHIDLPGLYTTKPCSTHQRPRSMPTVAFKLALIKPGTQGRLHDLWWTFIMIGDGRESPLTPANILSRDRDTGQ